MLYANIIKGIFKIEKGKCFTMSKDILGIDTLWNIAFTCTDKEIQEQAGKQLISINSQLGKPMIKAIANIGHEFCKMTLIKADIVKDDIESKMIAIRLIKDYIQKYNLGRYEKINKEIYKADPTIDINATVKRCDMPKKNIKIKINITLTISHLKNQISAMLKLSLNQFKVKHNIKKIELTDKYDNLSIKANFSKINQPQLTIEEISSSSAEKNKLLGVISNFTEGKARLKEYMKLDEILAIKVWSLLKDMSQNSEFTKFTKFDINNTKDWDKYLNPNKDKYEFIMKIHSLKNVIMEKEFDVNNKWDTIIDAVNKKLLEYLIEKYLVLMNDLKPHEYINAKILKYIARMIFKICAP